MIGDLIRQGLAGIVGNIEHRLNKLLPVTPKLGDGGVVVTHHFKALGEFSQDQGAHALADLMNIDIPHQMGTPVRGQQAVNQ